MIKITQTDEQLRKSVQEYDMVFDINGNTVAITVLFTSDMFENGEAEWKILSRTSPLSDEELDALDNYLSNR